MIPFDSVCSNLRKTRLIPEGDFLSALDKFEAREKLRTESGFADPVTADSVTADSETGPDPKGTRLLHFLESEHYLNRWQVSQLNQGRTRFHLGSYRIVDSLGAGGYGYVFLARTCDDPSNLGAAESEGHRPYDRAVKTLSHDGKSDDRRVARFLREIEINRLFVHPNLVRLTDSGESGKVDYAVYEYMDGRTAFQLTRKMSRISGCAASYIIAETAKALFHLHHHGFVHRDIKPGNILFSRSGEVKLGDLGLTVPLNADNFKPLLGSEADLSEASDSGGRVAGTSDYIPPDQILSPDTPNVLWDIYSLGCTFYFLTTGDVPFPSGTPHQKLQAHLRSEVPDPRMFNPGLPREVALLILEMMEKDPDRRPADANQVACRLAPFAADGRSELQSLLRKTLAPSPPSEQRHCRTSAGIIPDSALLEKLEEEEEEQIPAEPISVSADTEDDAASDHTSDFACIDPVPESASPPKPPLTIDQLKLQIKRLETAALVLKWISAALLVLAFLLLIAMM